MTSHINLRRIIWFSAVQWSGLEGAGNVWRQGFSLKLVQTVLMQWTLTWVSSYLYLRTHGRDPARGQTLVHTCVSEQVDFRACLCAQLVSRFVFLLPRQSYWPRSIFSQEVAAKQHGRRFRETWAWKEVNVVTEMCCELDNKTRTSGNVRGGRGGRRGAETTSQSNPHFVWNHTRLQVFCL